LIKTKYINEIEFSFILENTRHPGNIGACARALKNFGFSDLRLVNPEAEIFSSEAEKLAFGAKDILNKAEIHESMENAVSQMHLIIATSNKQREDKNLITPDQIIEKAKQYSADKVAILFGSENNGMSKKSLALAAYHCYIPIASDYPSLNLSQAVLLIAASLYQQLTKIKVKNHYKPITQEEKKNIIQFFQKKDELFQEGLKRMLSHSNWDDKDLRFFYYMIKKELST